MFVRGIGRRSIGTALQTSAFTNMSSTYQELNFVPSYPALPYVVVSMCVRVCFVGNRAGQKIKCASVKNG